MTEQSRLIDAEFLLLAVGAGIATAMDIESTVRAQRDPEAAEVNAWIYGERPSRARMYGVNAPLTAAFAYLAYHWRKTRPGGSRWVWRTPLVALSVGHAAAAAANLVNFREPRTSS